MRDLERCENYSCKKPTKIICDLWLWLCNKLLHVFRWTCELICCAIPFSGRDHRVWAKQIRSKAHHLADCIAFKVKTQKSFSIHFGEEEEKVPATPRKVHPEEKEGKNIPFYSSPSACVKNSFVHFLEKLSIRFSPYSHESIIKSRHIFSTKEETSAQLREEKGEADKSSRRIEKRRKEEKKRSISLMQIR